MMLNKISFTTLAIFVTFFSAGIANAQTSYNVSSAPTVYNMTSSRNWSASLPATCTTCTIHISTGVTVTVDKNITCQNCVFQGGTLAITNLTLNIQFAGSCASATYFNGTNLLVYGNSGSVVANAPVSIKNSTFNFNNSTSFKTNYGVDLVSSRLNLYNNSTMVSVSTGTNGSSINLSKSSQIVIGNGTQASGSSFTIGGPVINVYDNSSIVLANNNNAYNNLSKYNTYNTVNNSNASPISYATAGSTMNCGTGYMNSCSTLSLYGPATLSYAGTVASNTIPVVLVGFSAGLNCNKAVELNWDTKQEVNSGHFDIQRSVDGSVWHRIGTIKAKGTSSIGSDYIFTDQNPAAGINYYRLKLVNMDGSFGYTDVKVVRASLVNNIRFFPNPAHDYVNVSLGENAGTETTIRLINQAGQILQERKIAAGSGTTVSFPVQQYNTGLYILSVVGSDGSHESSKLLINRS